MEIVKTAIEGLLVIKPRVFEDARGYFFESFSQREFEEKVGKVFRVIIDRLDGEYYVARTEFDSPEVDPEVLIPVDSLPTESSGYDDGVQVPIALTPGTFQQVRITSASPYELMAELVNSN